MSALPFPVPPIRILPSMASESDPTNPHPPVDRRKPSTVAGLHMLHLLPAENWQALADACGIARADVDDAITRGHVTPGVQALLEWVAGWLWPYLAARTAIATGAGLRLQPADPGPGWSVRPTPLLYDALVTELMVSGPPALPVPSSAPEG